MHLAGLTMLCLQQLQTASRCATKQAQELSKGASKSELVEMNSVGALYKDDRNEYKVPMQ